MRITAKEIIALEPCWSDEEARKVAGKGKTPRQIAVHKAVSASDKRWVLTQLAARTKEGRNALLLWAAGCAQDVQHLAGEETQHDCASAIAATTAMAEGCGSKRDCEAAAAAAAAHARAASAAYAASAAAAAYAASWAAAAAAAAYAASWAAAAAAAAYAAAASWAASWAAASWAADADAMETKHITQLAEIVEWTMRIQ